MDKEQRVPIPLQPGGRYIVEVRGDGTWQATRIQTSDGTPAGAVPMPEVNAHLHRAARRAAAVAAALRDTD
jgi:hypothetical protein